MSTKQTICLCMIVKNEEHIIKETLNTIYSYIDRYVINDTGSTDRTKEIITNFFQQKNIPGEIIDHEFRTCKCHQGIYKKYDFFHFGWNRTYAIQQCINKGDYLLIIDADDLLVGPEKMPHLTHDSYKLIIGTNTIYKRIQIIKNDPSLEWTYVEPIHEYIKSGKNNPTEAVLPNFKLISRRLGNRNADSKKYLKDALIFEQLLKEDPNNERNVFYCAQSYFDYKNYNLAMKYYKKRSEMKCWKQEVFYSLYRIAICKQNLNYSWKEIEDSYMDAFQICKNRIEPLNEIVRHYFNEKNYTKCITIAKKAIRIDKIDDDALFVQKRNYDFEIWYYLGISCYQLKKYKEAVISLNKINDNFFATQSEKEEITKILSIISDFDKEICYFYADNIFLSSNNILLINFLDNLSKIFNIILVGNNIDNHFKYPNITTNMASQVECSYLILYESLNYFFNTAIKYKKLYFLSLDCQENFILSPDNIKITVNDNKLLSSLFENVNKILTTKESSIFKQFSLLQLENDINISEFFSKDYKCSLVNNNKISIIINKNSLLNNDSYANIIFNNLYEKYPFKDEIKYYQALFLKSIDFFKKIETDNIVLKEMINVQLVELYYFKEEYENSFNLANEVLERNYLPQELRKSLQIIRDKNIDFIADKTITLPKIKINKKNGGILLSMTTCKRFDLFEKTINSFLNCCEDFLLISEFLCVDDNSSQEDRRKMKNRYPFFTFIFKSEEQKGHVISMNLIHEFATKNNYTHLLHLEDDWHFIYKTNYITHALEIMEENDKIGQVLFNKNYMEIDSSKKFISGGINKETKKGYPYIIHEHYTSGTNEYNNCLKKYPQCLTNIYWPHFSFRPSIIKVEVLKKIGLFTSTPHFERDYANEYKTNSYISAFFDNFSCIHIGKKTWEKNIENAYHLNKQDQFSATNELLNIVIFGKFSQTNWIKFKNLAQKILPFYQIHNIRQINSLNDYEKKIFSNNSFNYLRIFINEIMGHLDIMRNNKAKYLLVITEKLSIDENLKIFIKEISNKEEEFIPFGTSNNLLELEGYLISQNYAKRLLVNFLKHPINLPYISLNSSEISINLNLSKYFTTIPGFKFYSQLDSFGNDKKYLPEKSVEELAELCKLLNCVAFNTYGYIKEKVVDLKDFIYLPNSTKSNHGIYILDSSVDCDINCV